MKIKYFIICIITSQFIWAYTRSRILDTTDPAKRCVLDPINSERCEDIRKKALEMGCIMKIEYETLKRNGSYPGCNILKGEGLEMLDGWCPCGCFAPETLVSIFDGESFLETKRRAGELVFGKEQELLVSHLSQASHLDNFTYNASKIRLKTFGKENKKIYRLKTKGQDELLLTERHPVLLASGVMKQIREVTEEDKLVLSTGESVEIESLVREPFHKQVVNFSVETEQNKEHLIFANNLVVGDQYWQASLEDLLNRVLLRKGPKP